MVIVDEGEARIHYQRIEIGASNLIVLVESEINNSFLSHFAKKKLLQIVFELKKYTRKIIVLLLAVSRVANQITAL